ncbi:uncharacterized protein LOC126887910 [Diabrotica virgifera virgifera]|uniref:Uncharacterized protein n=1 Tax=Diabrotica virgifera virgifera TaxID=50390 RepID=A0ABM5KNL8_DIAVI|nr:uncharacterized protein LOC126887910 [Diabrotica virgifera virgifera]
MSDGRKRLSGAEYKRLADLKAKREQKVIEQTHKISSFFKKPNPNCTLSTTSSTSTSNVEDESPTNRLRQIEIESESEDTKRTTEDRPSCEEVTVTNPNLNESNETDIANPTLKSFNTIEDPAL